MKFSQLRGVLGLMVVMCAVGCEEPIPMAPNSDLGHFIVGNAKVTAVGWEDHVVLMGPATNEQKCSQQTGECYFQTRELKLMEVRSLGPEVVEVIEHEPWTYESLKGGQVLIKGVTAGTVKLEATVEIGGEVLVDTFDVQTGVLATVTLGRVLDGIAPNSRYAGCTNSDPGAYVLGDASAFEVQLRMNKADAEGNPLTGFGQYPIDVEPADAVEMVEDELHGRFRIRPRQNGQIVLSSRHGASRLTFLFVDERAVDGMTPMVFSLDDQGVRIDVVTQLLQGRVYDVALFPTVQGAWLCGGDVTTTKRSLSPVNCGFWGNADAASEQLIEAHLAGECQMSFTLESANGGQGLSSTLTMDVIPSEFGEPGW